MTKFSAATWKPGLSRAAALVLVLTAAAVLSSCVIAPYPGYYGGYGRGYYGGGRGDYDRGGPGYWH